MRRIGLLGGMSWESTALYYRVINRAVGERLGGLHSADLVVVSVDFAEVERMQAEGRWDDAGDYLAERARDAERAGAQLLVLCTNTMHKVAPAIERAVRVPLLHLADTTAAAVGRTGLSTVGLLGTAFTMEQDFYRERLASHGFSVLVPGPDDRADVHRIIYDELCHGVVQPESRQRYLQVVQGLLEAGAQGIVLGCTEIELLLDPDDTPEVGVPLYPTARLHALAAVDAALSAAAP